MNKIIFFVVGIVACLSLIAQTDQGITHQAVVRNNVGELVTNSTIGVKLSILQGSYTGIDVYSEIHLPVSNAHGLITYIIGHGTIVSGIFDEIDWSDGPYFLKTEVDPTGGTNYSIEGTTQFHWVPYAMHAKTTDQPGPKGEQGEPGPPGDTKWAETANGISYMDGNVGIGTTSPSKRLTVNGDMEIGAAHNNYRHLRIGGGNSSGFLYGAFNQLGDGIHIGYNYYNDNTTHIIPNPAGKSSRILMGYGIISVLTTQTGNMVPTVGVSIGNGATSWSSVSDMRLKTNVEILTSVLDKISHIRGVTFNWKDGNQDEQIGFIAQEIQEVYPQVISKNENDHLEIRYTELIPVLLQAIKELQIQIETLEERIKILED